MAMRRRDLLAGTAILVLSTMKSRAAVISGGLPWTPDGGSPPVPVRPGPWHYFTSEDSPSGHWPTASFHRIRRRPAARMPAAPYSLTVSWPAPMAGPRVITLVPLLCPAPNSRARNPPTGRRRPIARRWLRSIDIGGVGSVGDRRALMASSFAGGPSSNHQGSTM
jgi:hypothetical protein